MTAFDYAVIALMVGSLLWGGVRGLVVELMALVAWIAAFWCAKHYVEAVAQYLPITLSPQGVRLATAFLLIFFLVWLVSVFVRLLLTHCLRLLGLGGANRFFGAVFGLLRGAVVVVVLVLIGDAMGLSASPIWKNALLAPPIEALLRHLTPWLPVLWADYALKLPLPISRSI